MRGWRVSREEAMEIRQACERDLSEVLDFYHEASDEMIGTPYDCRWRRDMHPTDELLARFVRSGDLATVWDGDVLVAAVGIDHDLGHDYGQLPWLADVPDEDIAVVHLLAVRKGYRGQGLSRQLLRASLNRAREMGMRTARLDATSNNAPANALYESEGFAVVGEGTQDIGPEDDPIVPFVVMERLL